MPLTNNPRDSPQLPKLTEFCSEVDLEIVADDLERGIPDGVRWLANRAQDKTETGLSQSRCMEVIEYRLREYYIS